MSGSFRLLLAVLFVIVTAVSVSAVTQGSALASSQCTLGTPTKLLLGTETSPENTYQFFTSAPCTGTTLPLSHKCVVVGSFNGEQSVQCADVAVSVSANGEFDAWAVGTYYCQGPNGIEKCGVMDVRDQFASKLQEPVPESTQTESITSYSCGPDCPAGKAMVGSGHYTTTTTGAICIEAWGVDLAGPDGSQVQLPDDPVNNIDASNFSSAHVNICLN